MGTDRFQQNDGPTHPAAGSTQACALIDSEIGPEEARDPRARLPTSQSSPPQSTGMLLVVAEAKGGNEMVVKDGVVTCIPARWG